MTKALLLRLLLAEMEEYGAEITFTTPPRADPALPDALLNGQASAEADALSAIAACLREDISDFTCIDRITGILEPLGYDTLPRHDFG